LNIQKLLSIYLLFSLLLFFRGIISYISYKNFISKKVVEVNGFVANQYKKKNYYVLKIKSKTLTFYTINRDNLKNLLNENISIKIFTKNISFKDYLFTFFAPGFDLRLKNVSEVEKYIEKQHKDKRIINLYKALYFGKSINYDIREKLSTIGISHLFALSGLHLGFLSGFLFLILSPIYKFFQQKFFPYRNKYFDLGIIILVVEFFYLYFTNFPPSLIRAFVMEIIIFSSLLYFEKDYFRVLVFTFLISLILFFEKVFTLSYFLSFVGVYYIFLFFKYFKVNWISSIMLSFYMFLMMFVVSHHFFYNFNFYQLLSPFINILFIFFYPLTIFLHIIGVGDLFDNLIKFYLDLGEKFYYVKVNSLIFISFIILSLIAYYKKQIFYVINIFGLTILGYSIFKGVL
jgi:competence protein ComEC